MRSKDITTVSAEPQPTGNFAEPQAKPTLWRRLPWWLVAPLLVALTFALYGPTVSYGITNWDDTWLIDNQWLSTFVANEAEYSTKDAESGSLADMEATLEAMRQDYSSEALGHIWNPNAPREVREELGNEYLPLRDMSYVLSFELSPMVFPDQAANAPQMVRLINILLHALNALLVFLLLAALTRRRGLAFLVALFFVVMPIHVESVVWLASRKELLSAFFLLLSLFFYVEARTQRGGESPTTGKFLCWWRFALCVLFFVCALLSKTPALVLPGLALLFELMRPKAFAPMRIGVGALVLGSLVLVSILHFVLISYPLADNGLVRGPYGDSLFASTLTSMAAQGRYWLAMVSGLLSIPAFDHPLLESLTLMAIFGLLTILGGLWALLCLGLRLKKSDGDHAPSELLVAALGLAWFLTSFVPVSNIFIQIGTVYADRYAYVPSVGFLIALIFAAAWLWKRFAAKAKWLTPALVVLAIAAFGWNAYRVTSVRDAWQDSTSLWARVMAEQPDNHLAIFNAGVSAQELAMQERDPSKRAELFEKARKHFLAALEQPAHTFRYDFARAHLALGELAYSTIDAQLTALTEAEGALKAFDERYADLDSNSDRDDRRALILKSIENARQGRDQAINEANSRASLAEAEVDKPWRTERDQHKVLARIHDLRGRVAFISPREGAKKEAREHFEKAKELEIDTPSVSHLNLANTIAAEAQAIIKRDGYGENVLKRVVPMFDQALEEIAIYIERNRLPSAQALIARATIRLHYGEALEGLNRRTPPAQAATLYRHAATDFLSAISYLRSKRFHREKELHDTLIKLAEALQRVPGQEESALSIVREAIHVSSDSPLSHLFEARLLMRLGRGNEAIEVLRMMLRQDRFPTYLPARIEFASLVIASVTSKRDALVSKWSDEYRADVIREGFEPPAKIPGDEIISRYYQRDEFAKVYRPILAESQIAARELLSIDEAETNATARELRRAGAEFLVQAGSALYRANDLVQAGAVLFQAFSLDETVTGAEELLAAIYLTAAEDASRQRRAALALKDTVAAEAFEKEYWTNVTNLLVLSKAARSKMAHRLYRQANAERFEIDKEFFYEEPVPIGEVANNGGKNTRQVFVPGKKPADYRYRMTYVIESYQSANLLDPDFPDPLTQLVDYYEKTKQFGLAVETFRKLESSLSEPNQVKYRNAVRETLGVHLIRWGASLVGEFRELARIDAKKAQAKRGEAVEKYKEAWGLWQVLLESERLRPAGPSRSIMSSAGIVAQELAKLTHPDEWAWYAKAMTIYREKPKSFPVEMIAVLQQMAVFTNSKDEKLAYLNEAREIAKTAEIVDRDQEVKSIEESIKWVLNRDSYERAQSAFDQKRLKDALDILKQGDLHYPRAEELRGQILEGLGETDAAADAYHAARSIDSAAVRAAELLLLRGKEPALIDAVLDLRQAQQSLEWRSAEAKARKEDASVYDALLARIALAYDGLDEAAGKLRTRAIENKEGLNANQRISFLQTAARISRSPIFALNSLAEYRDGLARRALDLWQSAVKEGADAEFLKSLKATALDYANNAWLDYQEVARRGAPFAWRTLLSAASFGIDVILPLRSDKADQRRIYETAKTMLDRQESEIERALGPNSQESDEIRASLNKLRQSGAVLKERVLAGLAALGEE